MTRAPQATRRRRTARERGAVAVEAALVLPLALIIVFGIIDFGLYFRANISFANASRTGAREATKAPRGTGFDDLAAKAVANEVNGGRISLSKMVIYRVNRNPGAGTPGLPVGITTRGDIPNCATDCRIYNWNSSTNQFTVQATPTFPASSLWACRPNSSFAWAVPAGTGWTTATGAFDDIGVYLTGTYNFITPLGNLIAGGFGSSRPVSSLTTMREEPVPSDQPPDALGHVCEGSQSAN